MKKAGDQAIELCRHITTFLESYAPTHLTSSENTLKSYTCTLSLYIEFLERSKGIDLSNFGIECFSRDTIEQWLEWLSRVRNSSPETCNCRLGALRTFLAFLASSNVQYLCLYQEATRINRRKTVKRKVRGMSETAVQALLACPDTESPVGVRDLCLMVFLYVTAARIGEVLSLKVSQLHLDGKNPLAVVVGKGEKLRTLYLTDLATDHIKAYLSIFHGDKPDPDAYLFFSRNKGKHTMMSQQAVRKMLRKYAKKAAVHCPEVPQKLHPHQFRHARASHWLNHGMNIVQLSFLLGHENIQTTMNYLDITLDEEREAIKVLEEEHNRKDIPQWKREDGSLRSLCGLI